MKLWPQDHTAECKCLDCAIERRKLVRLSSTPARVSSIEESRSFDPTEEQLAALPDEIKNLTRIQIGPLDC